MIETTAAETDQEKQAREALQAVLEPGETLLGFMHGKYTRSWLDTTQRFFIGLTYRRFVIVPMHRPRQTLSVNLQFLKSVSYTARRTNGRHGLILDFGQGFLSFHTYGPWEQKALGRVLFHDPSG